MRFVFLVQGEGRGHMTQALALCQLLVEDGHQVSHVFVGSSSRREIPSYFTEKIDSRVTLLHSPNFVTDKNNKSIKLLPTVIQNLPRAGQYLGELSKIHEVVTQEKPDMVINFYDMFGGLYYLRYRPKVPIVSVAHQFLAEHPDFKFVPGHRFDVFIYRLLNWITGYGTQLFLALSFRPYRENKGLTIVPPLLRREIKELETSDGDYIHGYILNDGYSEEIKQWHTENPKTPLEFFWDKKGAEDVTCIDNNLTFHKINDVKFLEKMAGSKAYVSTAGFESICEAMYLGKPIMIVPVEGHFEQACNAIDAVDAGAGVTNHTFDLDILMNYLPQHKDVSDSFRAWADQSKELILRALKSV
ncbi:MAG: glycosyltransferase family protein [Bacteroidota bacterium]